MDAPNTPPLSRKKKKDGDTRNCLSLTERVQALKMMDNGTPTAEVAQIMGVGRTQLYRLKNMKRKVLADYEICSNPNAKRRCKTTGNEQVNDAVWLWFQDASARNYILPGPLIQEKAREIAEELGVKTFKGSNGWLESFVTRHNIVFKKQCGERGDVNIEVVSEWKARLPELIDGYDASDVFNMDETGLFFRDCTRNTYVVKGDDCAGGKHSKERITVALCASMTGEFICFVYTLHPGTFLLQKTGYLMRSDTNMAEAVRSHPNSPEVPKNSFYNDTFTNQYAIVSQIRYLCNIIRKDTFHSL